MHGPMYIKICSSIFSCIASTDGNQRSVNQNFSFRNHRRLLERHECHTVAVEPLEVCSGEKILEIEGHMHRRVVMKCHFSTRVLVVSAALPHVNAVKQVDCLIQSSGVPRNFFRGGGSTNSVEDRENGDLGAVAP